MSTDPNVEGASPLPHFYRVRLRAQRRLLTSAGTSSPAMRLRNSAVRASSTPGPQCRGEGRRLHVLEDVLHAQQPGRTDQRKHSAEWLAGVHYVPTGVPNEG